MRYTIYNMPRRNRTPKHILRKLPVKEQTKIRYPTKKAAEAAMCQRILYEPTVLLRVYQSPHDGGWYLTSK